MTQVCKYCNKSFDNKAKRQFCSKSCANRFRWADNNFRQRMNDIMRSDEYRENMRNKSKETWADDEYHQKMINIHNSVETKVRRKISHNSDKSKEKHSIATRQNWKNGSYDNVFTDAYKSKLSAIHAKKWKNAEYANKRLNAYKKYKEYKLPSGRVIKLQGYEPYILDELLKKYSENDITIGIKEINKEVGKILYQYKNTEHRYFPDFYVKPTNTIIEVKSQWTYDRWKEKNLAKEQACLRRGFNFEFRIYKIK